MRSCPTESASFQASLNKLFIGRATLSRVMGLSFRERYEKKITI